MLSIDDYDELLALNRALMETRYLADKVDRATRGSALLSRIHGRLIDEIIGKLTATGQHRNAQEWREWRRLETRQIELPLILDYLKRTWRRDNSDSSKREIVANQLAPFEYSENDVRGIIAQLDAAPTDRPL